MYPLQITFGAASGLLSTILPPTVAALAALGGVWLSNDAAEKRARREAATQRKERLLEVEAEQAVVRRDRGLAALALAGHLEDFMLACSESVAATRSTTWEDPYTVSENSHSEPGYLPVLGEWPDLVDWKLLGLQSATEAAAFRKKVQLEAQRLTGYAENASLEDTYDEAAAISADLGAEAWELAEKARRDNQITPFIWHGDWSAIDNLREHQVRVAERRAAERAMIDEVQAARHPAEPEAPNEGP